mmetsp:Transcript_8677/g.7865  ORF Transcript_8677/g.7865 Transcript_8677/m.7865 type:complete len:141 (-) Transcript_8677:42-464(-)
MANETMEGLEYLDDSLASALKDSGRNVVIDMTSTLLSRPVNVENYGVIYASGGKNLGPAGVCLAIVRDDLIRPGQPPYVCPATGTDQLLPPRQQSGPLETYPHLSHERRLTYDYDLPAEQGSYKSRWSDLQHPTPEQLVL